MSDTFRSYFAENLNDQQIKAITAGDVMLTPSSRLLQKRQEAMEVHNALTLQRQDFESTLKALRVRKKELKVKEEQMKESLKKFDSFLKDNEVKRCRAIRKLSQERELIHQKQASLLDLQEDIKSLIKERDHLAKLVKKNAIYPKYLEKVVQASERFQEMHQVISRYETLKVMREDLLRLTQHNQESVEKSRGQLVRFVEQSNDTLLQHNNSLAELQSQLDKARADVTIWESRWAHIQNTAAKKTLLLGTIKMATLNLYYLCMRASGEAPVAPEDTFTQLEKIQMFFSDLIFICEEVSSSLKKIVVDH